MTDARLSALDLKIGQTVQIRTHGGQPTKYYTQLIGFVETEFIMLRVPRVDGWPVQFIEGQRLDVRVFSGVSLFEFQSHLIALLVHPRNYMTLACPTDIKQTRLRSHERARCVLPVKIARSPTGSFDEAGFEFHDLSGGGASLVGPQRLGESGCFLQIELSFRLQAMESDEKVLLDAEVQSVQGLSAQASNSHRYQHGIRFREVDPRILLLVYELLKPTAV